MLVLAPAAMVAQKQKAVAPPYVSPLGVYATYGAAEAVEALSQVSDSLVRRSADGAAPLIQIATESMAFAYAPIVGRALPKDTAAINRLLASPAARLRLPKGMRFLYSDHVDSQGRLVLFCVNGAEGMCVLDAPVYEAAIGEDEEDRPAVYVETDKKALHRITALFKSQRERFITTAVGGKVYSVQRVTEPMKDKEYWITGQFTNTQMSNMLRVLNSE